MDLGFYLLNIEDSKFSILDAINNLCMKRPYDNIIIFNNDNKTVNHNIAKYYFLHINQAKYFSGPLFMFDIKSMLLAKTFPSPSKQILWVSTPEWANDPSMAYSFWYNIYMQDNIELVTDNEQLWSVIDLCWKTPSTKPIPLNAEGLDYAINELCPTK